MRLYGRHTVGSNDELGSNILFSGPISVETFQSDLNMHVRSYMHYDRTPSRTLTG